ncbi:MAG: TetR/AcrR family transcriptional regulator [Gemmatimonadota bacterium]|nr:MAG: TetR/AcrR family transcriptional regulator [Gemmatimonadota bacterium]
MNDTPAELLSVATELFAEHGYDGTSIRMITDRAGANLGAVTYHFGSKEALYERVFETMMGPFRPYMLEAVGTEGSPLDRVERFVRALFNYLREHPTLPRLIIQHLASNLPVLDSVRRTIVGNIGQIAALIAEGQREGTIRDGDPTLMALSIGSQPLFLSLVSRTLREGTAIDQDDPETGQEIADSVVRFVRAGLALNPAKEP